MGDLSKHFNYAELVCPCCGEGRIHSQIGIILEIARNYEGNKPMSPNSGCRCEHHNEIVQMDADENYVPGSSKSKHMQDIAVDIPSKDPKGLGALYDFLFPDMYGIGTHKNFIHVDLRNKKARW